MKNYYLKRVDDVSLETYEDDGELFGDNGYEVEESYSVEQKEYILGKLTKKQRRVVELILQGYKRKEIAESIGVCLQAVHQIVPRIRRRMLIIPSVNQNIKKKLHDFT